MLHRKAKAIFVCLKSRPTYRWLAPEKAPESEIRELKKALDLPEAILRLLWQREIRSFDAAKNFFKPSLDALHDPFLMQDMDKAVARIDEARSKQERVLIYGDYDVDGTTAVALLSSFLEKFDLQLDVYIPDRYKEGYGVSLAGIDYAAENNFSLIIALDCGIKAIDKVNYALQKGIDFIICDHHTPGPEIPQALAVLDPKRSDCPYPYKGLSGCGVGFKLSQALNSHWAAPEALQWELLDLLALSIGADIVPMTGENRILAYYGLQKINQEPSPGLKALLEVAGADQKKLTISDLVFILAPRINAAGRLDHGRRAVELLKGKDLSLLAEIAAEIDRRNAERKDLDRNIASEALAQVEEKIPKDAYSTVVYASHWHKGVIGIVASRLIEHYYRPTVVLTQSGDKWAGSARSVNGFDLYEALEACEEQLIQFGGHPAAAGMTLSEKQLEPFKQAFEKAVRERIRQEQRQPQINYDLELEASSINPKLYRLLQRFGPFGPENMSPVIVCHSLVDVASRIVGKEGDHLKLSLCDPESGVILEGIGFGLGPLIDQVQKSSGLSVAFHLELNEFRGNVSLQMRVLDLKESSDIALNN